GPDVQSRRIELTIPPAADGDFQLDPAALHIWPRRSFMLIALPNPDRTFTCTLFLAFEADQADQASPGFDQLQTPSAVQAFFESHFPDVLPLMPDLLREFMRNPVGALSTIRLAPWHADGDLLLIGDAAHGIVPFFGQGMNAAFEDCTVLMQMLRQAGPTTTPAQWQDLFNAFSRARKPDTEAIADMALENFIEMRDRVADPLFLLHKQLSLRLEARYPDVFIPKYSLVSFHRVPYALAKLHGELQQEVLTQLCAGLSGPEDIERIDWNRAEELVRKFRQQAPSLNDPDT
ncbi:MAG: kynurenine 3-monooxygenase, partial [Candidatus Melainabacteria bacterium HGW-Melainabacteria-1]